MNDTTTAPARPRRRKDNRPLIFAIVVIVAAGGWFAWQKYSKKGAEEGEYFYAPVSIGDIEDLVTSTGTLQPRDYVDVGAQVSGQIEKLFVEVGDVVKVGDVLVEIDATTAKAKVEANQAQLLSSQTNLKTQESNFEKAKRDYQRQVNLKAEDATTEEAVLNAKTTLDNAERSIVSSKAQIAQQEANMRIEANNLKYTTITAPIAGTVMTIDVKQGQTINATQQAPKVMRIANLSTMTVQSEVSEADVAKLYKGINVYFTTLGGGNRRWYSSLKRIEPTPKVQNSVVLYNALFDVQNDNGSLMPSMTTQVFFVSAEARQVLTVPMAALQQGQQIQRELAEAARAKAGPDAAAAKTPATANGGPAATTAAAPAGAAGAASASGAATQAGAPGPGQGGRPAGAPAGSAAGAPGAGGGPGGPGGGFPGGFNGGPMTPEQIEQFRRMRQAGGQGGFGQGGGFGQRGAGGAGGFGQRNGGQNAAAGAPRQPQQRRGTVMVKKADGTLEARPVVIGVTNRVVGQVLSGLKEGEEVVIGRSETESAATPSSPSQNNQQGNRNFQGGPPGGFPGGGGGGFPGGGRPF